MIYDDVFILLCVFNRHEHACLLIYLYTDRFYIIMICLELSFVVYDNYSYSVFCPNLQIMSAEVCKSVAVKPDFAC